MEDHVRGNPRARLTLVEYADFECPYCAMAYPFVKRISERFERDVAEIFRPFPLMRIHPHALHAAQAAEAAALQDKFWEMHDILFENRAELDDDHLIEYAGTIGLDLDRFKSDFASPAVLAAIQRSMKRGADEGVTGTPSFFLNGAPLDFERYEDLEDAVAKAVAALA